MLGAAMAFPVYIMVLAVRHSTPANFFFFAIQMKEANNDTREREFGLKMLDFYSY